MSLTQALAEKKIFIQKLDLDAKIVTLKDDNKGMADQLESSKVSRSWQFHLFFRASRWWDVCDCCCATISEQELESEVTYTLGSKTIRWFVSFDGDNLKMRATNKTEPVALTLDGWVLLESDCCGFEDLQVMLKMVQGGARNSAVASPMGQIHQPSSAPPPMPPVQLSMAGPPVQFVAPPPMPPVQMSGPPSPYMAGPPVQFMAPPSAFAPPAPLMYSPQQPVYAQPPPGYHVSRIVYMNRA